MKFPYFENTSMNSWFKFKIIYKSQHFLAESTMPYKKKKSMFTNPAKNCNKLSTSVLFTSFWGLASPYRKVLQLWYPGWWSVEIFLFLWFCFFYLNLINLVKRSQNPMGWNVRPVFKKYCALNWPNTSQLHVGSNAVILVHGWAQLIRVFEK